MGWQHSHNTLQSITPKLTVLQLSCIPGSKSAAEEEQSIRKLG